MLRYILSGALWVVTILVSMSTMGANFAGVEWAQDVAGYDPTPSPRPQQKAAPELSGAAFRLCGSVSASADGIFPCPRRSML